MPHAHPIKNRLRMSRKLAQLTQREVAKHIKLKSPSQISRWETGERVPNLLQALTLSALYRRLVNDLFFDLFQEQRDRIVQKEKQLTQSG